MTTLTDAILAKFNTAVARADAASGKVDAETSRASGVEDALAARLAVVEGNYVDAKAAFELCQTTINEQKARIDALVSALSALGVSSGI